jgi:hypothetical protein
MIEEHGVENDSQGRIWNLGHPVEIKRVNPRVIEIELFKVLLR